MKLVTALVGMEQVEKVVKSISALGITGMTLSEVKCVDISCTSALGMERQGYRPKVKMEIALKDDKLDSLISLLAAEDIDTSINLYRIGSLDI